MRGIARLKKALSRQLDGRVVRKPVYTIPPISDMSENIIRAISQGPPKKQWDYTGKRSKERPA